MIISLIMLAAADVRSLVSKILDVPGEEHLFTYEKYSRRQKEG